MTDDLPTWLDLIAWSEFVEHRREIKKPLTRLAIKKNHQVLEKQKHLQQEIIDNSIKSCWTGLFNIKEKTHEEKMVTNEDWSRMGCELNIHARPGESWSRLRDRISKAIKH